MLEASGFPLYLYLKNGNPYSGEHHGMRYCLTPGKRPDPNDPDGKKTVSFIVAAVWPGPWCLESTDPARVERCEFPGSQDGEDAAVAWLNEKYREKQELWHRPVSILDSEPWTAPAESASE